MPINSKVSLCGARCRTKGGAPCLQPSVKTCKTGRCRMHGGFAGPKTPEGKLRAAQANLKHGLYTKEAMMEKMKMRMMMKWRDDLKEL